MSKFTDYLATSQTISGAAVEEADRMGHPAIDADHLLLALATMDDPAGRLLRAHGAGLHALRAATQRVHAARIASLGVTPPDAEPRSLRDPSAGEYEWSKRALGVMRSVTDYSSGLGVLAALAEEPSGLVAEILAAAGVSLPELRAAIGREQGPSRVEKRSMPALASVSTHVPATPERVWELVADPARRAEWDALVGGAAADDDGTWLLDMAERWPNGRPLKRRKGHQRLRLRVLDAEECRRLDFAVSLPDSRRPRVEQRSRFDVQPDGAGATVRLTVYPSAGGGWRSAWRALIRPLARLGARQRTSMQLAGISRALR